MIFHKFRKISFTHFNQFCSKPKHEMLSKKLMLVIDTHNVVQELKIAGFNETQAEELKNFALNLLNTQSEILEDMNKQILQKQEFELYNQKLMSEMSNLKRDLLNSSSENFNSIKHENEKFKMELQLLRQHLKDEIDKTNNVLSLNINLEKSRSGDEHNQIRSEIIKTQNRIDTQVANLRTSFEQYRHDMLKYAVATAIAIAGLLGTFYRLWKY